MRRAHRLMIVVFFALTAPLACGGGEDATSSSGGSSAAGAGGSAPASVCDGACDALWQCPGGAELRQCATSTACGFCIFGTASPGVLVEHACDSCQSCEGAFKDSDAACSASGGCVRNEPLDAECAQKGLPAKGFFCAKSNVSIPSDCKTTGSASGVAYCCP